MKRVLSILLMLSISLFAFSSKPVFLLLYTDDCIHCQSFLNNTMSDLKIKKTLQNFTVEAINVSKHKEVPYDIDFTGVVPSIHLMDKNRVQLANTVTGNIPPADLNAFLQKFLHLYDEYQSSLK